MERVFISYKRVDKDRVFSIKDNIEKSVGVDCWIDLDGIESDAQFANVIINAINNSEVFLFMYSHSHSEIADYDTDWTVREINFAQKKKKRIVFINLDGTALTDWFELMFGTKQQIDAMSESAMQKLFRDLKKWLKTEIDNKKEMELEPEPVIEPESIPEVSQMSRKADMRQTKNRIPDNIEKLYQEGVSYFTTFHDNEKAIEYLERAAIAGHVDAQNLLGVALYKESDYGKAFRWLEKAAEQGHSKAQYNLGKLYYIYYNGYLGNEDYSNALKWLMAAANNGDDEAINMLGVMYEEGKGVARDYNTAYEYYLIAANAGNVAAQYNIGCLIVQNKVTQYKLDRSDAIKWFEMAARHGDRDAENELKKLRK